MENLNSFDSPSQPGSVTLAEDGEISSHVSGAELLVIPRQSLVDEKISISVKGLSPGQPVTLAAKLIGDSKEEFGSFGHFVADEAGKVSVSDHSCLSGSYTGVDPMGLLWSMQLSPGQRKGQRLSKKDVTKPYCIQLQLFDGHIEDVANCEGLPPMAGVTFEKWYMADGVRRIPVRDGRVRGTLFIPPGQGPFPGMGSFFYSTKISYL